MKIKCPHCGKEIDIDDDAIASEHARIIGSISTPAKRKSSAANLDGHRRGWPKGKKRKTQEPG